MQTGPSGVYGFGGLDPGSFTVRASRQGVATGALSSLDAAWALQAAVGRRELGPTQFLACDVTGNGIVSSLDAARILQRVVGMMPVLPIAQACGSDLLVVPLPGMPGAVPPVMQTGACNPGSFAFDPLASSVGDADFEAAYFGDCTLNGGNAPTGGGSARVSAPVSARLGRERRRRRRFVQLPLYVTGTRRFSALDVTLRYDPGNVRLVRIRETRTGAGMLALSMAASPGTVRRVVATSTPAALGTEPVLVVTFERLKRDAQGVGLVDVRVDDQPARLAFPDKSRSRSELLE